MKKLVFLFVLLGLCIAPFWKSEYRKRWEAQQEENEENTEHQFVCGTRDDMSFHEAVNHYQPSANGVDGKALFKANCVPCHNNPASNIRDGFSLRGILDRIPGGNWRYDFIHDSKKVIASGDAYANYIFKEYNESVMPAFPHLSNEEIDQLLIYCNE